MAITWEYFFIFAASFSCTVLFLLRTALGERLRTWWMLKAIFVRPRPLRVPLTGLSNSALPRSATRRQTLAKRIKANPLDTPEALVDSPATGIAVVTYYLNPTNDLAIRRAYCHLRSELLELGASVFAAEVVFHGQEYPTECATLRAVADSNHNTWSREQLLNSLVELLPEQYHSIAWIDPGVKLLNPAWLRLARDIITRVPVARLFQAAVIVDPDGRLHSSVPAAIAPRQQGAARHEYLTERHEPYYGGAWIAHRSIFPLCAGLSADIAEAAMVHGWCGRPYHLETEDISKDTVNGYRLWADAGHRKVQSTIGVIPGHALIQDVAHRH